jgi:3-oxoadipate enol-lactonase
MRPEDAVIGRAIGDGCALAYRVEGAPDRPALLLSNSLGTTADMWAPQMPALLSRFRVIRYDTRGHGSSDAPAGEYTIDELGRDALSVLDAAGAARAHVCGLSLGGVTAMWLGVHAPDRIASLVLASTAARIGTVDMWNERIRQVLERGTGSIADAVMARWFTETFRRQHPSIVSSFRTMLASTPTAGYAGCCAALRAADLRESITRITAPTLVIAGASDPATPPADGRDIHARIGGSGIRILDASHLANVEQPDQFSEAVADFIVNKGWRAHVAE